MKKWFVGALILGCDVSARDFIQNYVEAHIFEHPEMVKSYLWASAERNADAAYNLGMLYLSDGYFKKNVKIAEYFIKKASSMGDKRAIKALGDGYYSGDIVEADVNRAIQYYEKSGHLGYGPAQYSAGVVYMKYMPALDKKTALKKAIYWFKKAVANVEFDDLMRKSASEFLRHAESELKQIAKNAKRPTT